MGINFAGKNCSTDLYFAEKKKSGNHNCFLGLQTLETIRRDYLITIVRLILTTKFAFWLSKLKSSSVLFYILCLLFAYHYSSSVVLNSSFSSSALIVVIALHSLSNSGLNQIFYRFTGLINHAGCWEFTLKEISARKALFQLCGT